MSMREIVKNSTDQSVVIRIIDSSDGTPETGVEHNTAGIDLWYRREGATKTAITEAALAALDSAHSDGGIEAIGDGYYRLDLPDAAVATGVNGVMVGGTVTGMIVIGCYVPLVDYNPYDSVRAGLTALPNAAADAAGGIPVSDAGGLDMDNLKSELDGLQGTDGKTLISTDAQDLSGTLDVNMKAISGDTTAADNLESQYDTTGLTGDTFPATQAQVGAIAGISAAGFPTESEADNTGGAIKTITFVGTQTSGTYVSTEAENATYHQIDDDTNAIDIVYQFDLRGDRQGTEVIFKGYLSGANDVIVVQVYDYVGSDWETRATISGQAGSTNIDRIFTLLSKHTGISGSDRGKCLIRFVCSGQSNPTLYVDELLVVATSLAQSVGYARGSVWIDTAASNTNTVDFVDGVADNPVSTIAAALTIAASVGLVHFEIATGSSITLGATVDGKTFNGKNWTLALGGQSCSDSVFVGATVSGTCTGASKPRFERCIINAVTLPPSIMLVCGLASTITIGSAGEFFFIDCASLVAGTSTPVLDFGSALNSSNVSFRNYSGGIEIQQMGAGTGTYNMSLEGNGALIINANCSATSNISLRGNFKQTDNASGAVTVTTDDDTTSIVTIRDQIGTAGAGLTDLGGMSSGMKAEVHSEANDALLVDTTIAVVNSQTEFTLTAGSDVNNVYNLQLVVMYDASNSNYPCVRNVTDYVGSTKTLTIHQAPFFTIAPGDGVKIFAMRGTDVAAMASSLSSHHSAMGLIGLTADYIYARIGQPADIDGGGASIAANLKKLADDNAGGDFDATTDSLNKIKTSGAADFTTVEKNQMRYRLGIDGTTAIPSDNVPHISRGHFPNKG